MINYKLQADTDRDRNLKIYSLLERLTQDSKITWNKTESSEREVFTAMVGPFSAHLMVEPDSMRIKIITGDLAGDGALYAFGTPNTVMEELRLYGGYETMFDLYQAIRRSSALNGRTQRDDLIDFLETL